MVYIEAWDDFVDRSVQLFRDNPETARYVMKYRHCDGKLVLKVTDNKQKYVLMGFRQDVSEDMLTRVGYDEEKAMEMLTRVASILC